MVFYKKRKEQENESASFAWSSRVADSKMELTQMGACNKLKWDHKFELFFQKLWTFHSIATFPLSLQPESKHILHIPLSKLIHRR